MNLPAARIGLFVFLSVIAVAAVAGSVALSRSRRPDPVEDALHACWGASAG
ncbi:MAG TPA: hypothetical protein VEV38_10040 [Candidatus Eremiobacteraceae bacterium]|nr:hypothetical protein [Candidatus Eremiobacteraceae bacterium]